MQFRLGDLIEKLPDHAKKLIRSEHKVTAWPLPSPFEWGDVLVTGARSIELAEASDVTFYKTRYLNAQSKSRIRIVQWPEPEDFVSEKDVLYIWTERPRLLLAYLMQPFLTEKPFFEEWPFGVAQASLGTKIGGSVCIGPDVTVGKDCVIWHNVTIGGDGFGFEVDERTGNVIKMPHFGRVIIGDRVEIQSGAQIARGSLGDTIIEDDVKIDQLVHVAHNVHIKRGAMIIAHAMLGGSSVIGEYSWIAPHTTVREEITIGRCSMTGLGAVVVNDVGDNELVIGCPARKLRDRFPPDHPLLGLSDV